MKSRPTLAGNHGPAEPGGRAATGDALGKYTGHVVKAAAVRASRMLPGLVDVHGHDGSAGTALPGHGERCVAVGAIDMALWGAAAKIAGLPLHQFLAGRLGREANPSCHAKTAVNRRCECVPLACGA
jgi:L-alanine-DL-glutamate epimerase-like enolase superfamily enzyme